MQTTQIFLKYGTFGIIYLIRVILCDETRIVLQVPHLNFQDMTTALIWNIHWVTNLVEI